MLTAEERYLEFHKDRYRLLLQKAGLSLSRHGTVSHLVLIAGPSHEVRLVAERFPQSRVETLGIFDPRYPAPSGRHWEMDLNQCRRRELWPQAGPYDLIVLAEVIEHLKTSPRAVFDFLRSLLAPLGELIVQTPNAASLAKRWNLLAGRNPFMQIPDDPDTSQHWREYTAAELIAFAGDARLNAVDLSIDNCYRHEGNRARFYLTVSRLAPPAMRDCITLTLRSIADD